MRTAKGFKKFSNKGNAGNSAMITSGGTKTKGKKKTAKNVRQIAEGVKKAASRKKKGLKIHYNRSTRQWERPKYMRRAEFERQLAEKEAMYVKRRARDVRRLFERANERVSQLLASGLESDALRNLDLAGRESYYFSTEGKNKADLMAEIQMVKDFMQNPTSTISGAEQYTRELFSSSWKETHGGEYEELYAKQAEKVKEQGSFEGFNERIIKLNGKFYIVNNDEASLAFAAYREALSGGLAAEGMFDSESLITYAFSFVEDQGLEKRNDDTMGMTIDALRNFIDTKKSLRSKEFEQAFKRANAVSTVVADEGEEILTALGIK